MNTLEIFDGLALRDSNLRMVAFVTDGTYDDDAVVAAAEKFVTYLNENVTGGFVEALYDALSNGRNERDPRLVYPVTALEDVPDEWSNTPTIEPGRCDKT